MGLDLYRKKRDFTKTSEPAPAKVAAPKGKALGFCVQKHDATRLHYDFRLELGGVLLSWAVTRGPSLDPKDKRLAVRTEDHPIAYGNFEGTIPEGEYGGGTVMLWDTGTWTPLDDNPHAALKKGHLSFKLEGQRMKGRWNLIRMRGGANEKRENWLLIKEKDEESKTGSKAERYLDANAYSIKTGRKMQEIAEGMKQGKSDAKAVKPKKKVSARTPRMSKERTGAKKKPITKLSDLRDIYPAVQLATLVDAPPKGENWIHEMKYDGYRILCYVAAGGVAIYTRNGNDWTERFPAVAEALSKLRVKDAVLDGEAVVLDDKGRTKFYSLQEALGDGGDTGVIQAYFFDLLRLDSEDISKQPLRQRKEILKKLLKSAKPPLYYSEHLKEHSDLLKTACSMGMEGLVSKNAEAEYAPGRGKYWLKSKCGQRQEFVIVGYTASKSGPRSMGALHIGYHKGGKLKYGGKVGTGFGYEMANIILKKLQPLAIDRPHIKDTPREAWRSTTWVKPKILCEVSFTEWTPSGLVRHPSFEGLRDDKPARDIVKEQPKPMTLKKKTANKSDDPVVEGITISHPDRIIFEGIDATKLELAKYYAAVASYMLPHIKKRHISLMRCPAGAKQECFFQRNPDAHMKKYVTPFRHMQKGKKHEYLYIEDAKGIVFLSQMGAIELHPWGATVEDISHPTRMIFDLDPDPAVPFEAVKLAALDLRARLKKLGLESFVKTTGGKGLHVTVPLGDTQDWETVKGWAQAFAQKMESDVPEAYITTMSKAKRKGKIFIDYFRNDTTATAIADYSVRARKGAPVAVPLEWRELKSLKSGDAFNIRTMLKRLKAGKIVTPKWPKQKLPDL